MENLLERLRRAEMESVRRWIKPGMRVLELGGGTGFQASILHSWGAKVISFDVPTRTNPYTQFHPVLSYSGSRIPVINSTIDVVFSSNVLEHVKEVEALQEEIKRVLRSNGLAVHILPSTSWRLWTLASHYPFVLRWLTGRQRLVPGIIEQLPEIQSLPAPVLFKQMLLAGAHGEHGGSLAELYLFSRKRWKKVFSKAGFEITDVKSNGVFYTGYATFPALPMKVRRTLATLLGNSAHVYVLRKV